MSALYVYGLQDSPLKGSASGLRGEPVTGLLVAGLVAAVGSAEGAPPMEEWALRGHGAAVERLAGACEAFLPARFGTLFEDQATLAAAVVPMQGQIERALAEVRGCQQMTLRIYGQATPPPAAEEGMSGSAYLASRRVHGRPAALRPLLDELAQELGDVVRGERVEAATSPPLLGSIYHLVPRGLAGRYLVRLACLEGRDAELHWTASGPWAAYAFAPEVSP